LLQRSRPADIITSIRRQSRMSTKRSGLSQRVHAATLHPNPYQSSGYQTHLPAVPNKDSQERSAWFARRVPGGLAFGRAFHDNHRPIIRLTDPTQKLAALATLDSLAPSNGRPRVMGADSMTAVRVRWDFAELYDWMQYLQSAFSEGPPLGVNSGWIDTNNDRILFGVEMRESVPKLVSWLIDEGVSCRLVAIRVNGPIRGI
jgi:hypothetical protein